MSISNGTIYFSERLEGFNNLGMIRLPSGDHISRFCGLRENKPFKGKYMVLIFNNPNINPGSD